MSDIFIKGSLNDIFNSETSDNTFSNILDEFSITSDNRNETSEFVPNTIDFSETSINMHGGFNQFSQTSEMSENNDVNKLVSMLTSESENFDTIMSITATEDL